MRLVAGFVVGALLLAGCGSDTSDDPLGGSGGGERSQEELDADVEAAEAILLTIDDFPSGWEAEASEDSPSDEALDRSLAECLGISVEELNPNNPFASADFASPDDESVNARATVTASVEKAEATIERYEKDETLDCYRDAVEAAMRQSILESDTPTDLEFGEVTLERLSVGSLGDDAVGLRITVPMMTSRFEVPFYLDVMLVRVGRVGLTGSFTSTFTPFSQDTAAALMETMVERVPTDL